MRKNILVTRIFTLTMIQFIGDFMNGSEEEMNSNSSLE